MLKETMLDLALLVKTKLLYECTFKPVSNLPNLGIL